MSTSLGVYIRRSSLAFAASACVCALPSNHGEAAAKSAPRTDDIRSEQVNYADLDLSRKANQWILKSRIHSAAIRVCNFDGFLDTACADMATVDGWNQALPMLRADVSSGSTAAAVLIVSGTSNH